MKIVFFLMKIAFFSFKNKKIPLMKRGTMFFIFYLLKANGYFTLE